MRGHRGLTSAIGSKVTGRTLSEDQAIVGPCLGYLSRHYRVGCRGRAGDHDLLEWTSVDISGLRQAVCADCTSDPPVRGRMTLLKNTCHSIRIKSVDFAPLDLNICWSLTRAAMCWSIGDWGNHRVNLWPTSAQWKCEMVSAKSLSIIWRDRILENSLWCSASNSLN